MNYLTEYTWMQALGWTLIHSLWQASLIAIAWAICRQFLKRSSAQKRYLAAIGAIFTLLLCSMITFWQLLPELVESSLPVSAGLEAISLPTLDDIPAALISIEASESWTDFFDTIAPWLSLLWILGAVIMGIRFSGGLWYVHRLRHTAITPLDDEWQKRADTIARKLGLKRVWQLMESELVTQPLTLGHFKPLVLIPVGMLSGLSPEQVEAILAHEFAHIRRADFLFNLIQSLIEILFFYHPAVWWLSREIRKERELCCDDMAVAAMGDAFTYAEALTRLQLFRHSPQHFLTMQAKGKSGSFTARIHRLFAPSPSGPSLWKSFSAALLLSMAILGSGYYAYTQSQEFTQTHIEETLPEGELIMFTSDASLEDLDLFVREMQIEYGIDLEVLDTKLDEEGNFQMISLSYFNPETQLKKGYKAENFAALIFQIDISQTNPLQLGFTSKGKEEAVMETFALEAITEEVVGPPLGETNTPAEGQEVIQESIIAEFRLKPSSSPFQVSEINKNIRELTGKRIFTSRNEAGTITEFFQISEHEGKYGKMGFRNFKDLEIIIKKENGQAPKIAISDAYGQAFWTDEISMHKLNIYPWTSKEAIDDWLSQLNTNIELESYITDDNGKLLEIKINENGNVATSSVPCQYHLLRDENGKTLSVGVKAGPPALIENIQKPVLVYLDGKSLGFYEADLNTIPKILIKEGHFNSHDDLGKITVFTTGNRDLEKFFLEEQLPPPPPMKQSELIKDFHVYALFSWEYLAQKFEAEGNEKHRMYIYEGGNVGFIPGNIKEGIMEVCKRRGIDTRSVTAIKLNPEDAERRFKIKSVEVIEVRLKDPSEIKERPNITKKRSEDGIIEIKGNISFDGKKGPMSIEGGSLGVNPDASLFSKGPENYYFFDGKPLGYRKGQIFAVIAQEVKERNLDKIGGIVICNGEELNGKEYKTVQILSEEYEEEYYQKAEEKNPIALKIEGLETKPEIWLDGEEISMESLQQLDPKVIATIDLLKDEAARDFSGNTESKDIIHLRTNRKTSPVIAKKLSTKFKIEPATALEMKVSPNPSSETFNIDFELNIRTEVKFSIRDLQGKLIHKVPAAILEAGPQKIIWKANKIPNGIYIAQLETAEGIVASQRLVLER
ncbi:MAG: M56 family metallopeptidase [Bacteroidia bacterium]|nr:M56 family metallopeptidase [Bacteroidia bacterium]